MTAPDPFRLDGRTALVTGGGTGIGRGIAEAFTAAGARVAVAGRRREPLDGTLRALGAGAIAVEADVTVAADRVRLVAETVSALGGLDVLVNCAGAATSGSIEDTDPSAWEHMFAVNLTAVNELSRLALPHLRRRRGNILNISTGASLQPVPNFAAYGASKAAVNYASQVLAMEAAPDVRVNVICPGGVETDLFRTFVPEAELPQVLDRFREMTPLGRVGQPADIAHAAVYLASAAAAWVTGAILTVDGGMNLG
jgi:NAD(P)-dependent dehydrogenase (short-subunit alcohol dehydrogenase family)